MPMRSIIYDVWIANIVLQVALALVLLAKRTWQSFPAFSAYIFYSVFEAAAIYAVSGRGMVYYYTFWACEAIGIFLGLAVVREIFTNLFSPHPALRKLAAVTFRVAVVALVVLACAVYFTESGNAKGISNAVMLAAEGARVVEVGLIMFLFLFSSVFGLHWRQNVFGMALGLGLFAAVELVTVKLIGHVSPPIVRAFYLVHGVSFCTTLLIWLGYLVVPEHDTGSAEMPHHDQLEQWNQAVMELISR
jgi:hypothetical protein